MKKIVLVVFLILIIFLFGKNLNPFSSSMFEFHDSTQLARINQFTLNLKELKIPPRIAPDFSFKLGFPVFNYYAPTSYWITSFINLLGISEINSLKISFLLALILSFIFMFKFLHLYFDFYFALIGALAYTSSPWLASEIFVRGNLAEIWFITLLPLAFYMVKKNSLSSNKKTFILTTIFLSLTLTTHNVLSLILFFILIFFILINKNPLKNFLALFLSFLINSYYFIPAILEMPLVQATNLVKNTIYSDHLLCPWQLWTTPYWGYGGSIKGCLDGMSFMMGKIQIILSFIGIVLFFYSIFNKKNKKENNKDSLFFLSLFLISFFLITNISFAFSKFFEPILSYLQYPWRFLTFYLFSSIFFIGKIGKNNLLKKTKNLKIFIVFIGLIIILHNSKFFKKQTLINNIYQQKYLSQNYIENQAAYNIAEYLPKTVDYKFWRSLEKKNEINLNNNFVYSLTGNQPKIIVDKPFLKSAEIYPGDNILNISYLPYWKIYLNKKSYQPKNLDSLGRPIISIYQPTKINIQYQQTLIEKISNLLTLISFIILFIFSKKFSKIKI